MTTKKLNETESLSSHVELCTIRYDNLDNKLTNLEVRMDILEKHVRDIKSSLIPKEEHKSNLNITVIVVGIIVSSAIGFFVSRLSS